MNSHQPESNNQSLQSRPDSLRILVVEDSGQDYELIIYSLKKGGFQNLISHQVQTRDELLDALKTNIWDVILSDYNVPGFDAFEGLSLVRDIDQDMPFIVVSGGIGEESVADMMRAGVEDFVMKSRLDRLPSAVSRVLREKNLKETEALAKAEAQSALLEREKMISIVSHDIKNPLSAIQLSAELLLKSNADPAVTLHANRILETTERMKSLIYDLLDRKTTQEGLFHINKSRNNLAIILDEAVHAFESEKERKGISFKVITPDDSVFLDIDKSKIYQVLTNLISNACKFTNPSTEVLIQLLVKDESICIEVIDQGIGIDPRHHKKVFDEKWTTASHSEEGHGLGLFICKKIIDAHDGEIGVESQPNQGSNFWFTLPGPLYKTLRDDSMRSAKDKPLVMVVDDDDDLRDVVTWALKSDGLQVVSYADPQAALDQLTARTVYPDVLIVDYHMGSMTAGDFLLVKENLPDERIKQCPSIIMTAAPQNARRIPGSERYDILEKPLDLKGLISRVSNLCSR